LPWLSLRLANGDDELSSIVNHQEAFISLSSYEGFGLALYEAYSAGLAVYCLKELPVTEYIDKNAIFFEDLDPQLVIDSIRQQRINYENVNVSTLRTWSNLGGELLRIFRDE
ncbi:MAG: glycosyltransferase, partial [Flavobacteriales bacterium]|nr:glycosyltransferase [Flavobacteriales bacterium]